MLELMKIVYLSTKERPYKQIDIKDYWLPDVRLSLVKLNRNIKDCQENGKNCETMLVNMEKLREKIRRLIF